MSALQEYEIEIKEKKSFLTRILQKIIPKKNQFLLGPGTKDDFLKTTDLMWRITGFKSNLFDKFDVLKKKNIIKNEKDKIFFEIIGENNIKDEVNIANKKIEKLIIPRNVNIDKKEI